MSKTNTIVASGSRTSEDMGEHEMGRADCAKQAWEHDALFVCEETHLEASLRYSPGSGLSPVQI